MENMLEMVTFIFICFLQTANFLITNVTLDRTNLGVEQPSYKKADFSGNVGN